MQRSNNTQLALLAAITIGLVNIASLSVVYLVFHDAHKPAQSALAQGSTGASGGTNTLGSAGTTDQTGASVDGAAGTTGGSAQSPSVTNGSSPATSSPSGGGSTKGPGGTTGGSTGGSSPGSGSGGGTTTPSPPPPAGPNSLAKGSPCTTQTPPAGVCTAVLSFNNQKDGNPYWDPGLLSDIKAGIANDSFVKLLGLNPTTIYNSMTVTIKENTWSGSATHCTIQGTMSAEGQSQATTFTLDWNGSKWIVDDAAEN